MTIAACPRCDDQVSVPPGAPAEAIVQCPLCQEEFELSEVLEAMPPALVVIKSPAGDSPKESSDNYPFGGDDDSGGFQLAEFDDEKKSDDSPSFAFDASDDAGIGGEASTGSTSARPAPRKKKKSKNPAIEIAKVAGGGIGGVMIAIVLLWYLPGRYGQDILGIGPTIAEIPVLKMIVPTKFRGGNNSATNPNDGTSMGEPVFKPTPGPDDGRRRSIADFAPTPEGGDDELTNLDLTPSDEPVDLASNEPADLGPLVDFDNLNTPTEPDNGSPAAPRAPGGQPVGPKQRMAITPADLKTAVEAVVKSTPEYAASVDLSRDEWRKTSADHYNDYATLAEALTFIDQNESSIRNDVVTASNLLAELGADEKKSGIMLYFAATQLNDPPETPAGIMIIGDVTAMKTVGRNLYATEVAFTPAGGDARSVTLLSSVNPADAADGYTEGSKIVALGAVVSNPSENLRGYKGDDATVIWAGYSVPLDN